jgi:hypothetical protein
MSAGGGSQPKPLGFERVHGPQPPTADLIFIHGLDGHRKNTWKSKDTVWLEWLKDHFPDASVSTYGYDAKIFSTPKLDPNLFLSELSEHRGSVHILF